MSGLDMLLFWVIVVCGYTDFKYRKIYNIVLFPALLLALLYQLKLFGLSGFYDWGQGLLLGLAFLLIPYLLGGMGAGDVKLLGVIGAIKGPVFVFYCFIGAAIIGGLMSVGLLLYRKKLSQVIGNIGFVLFNVATSGISNTKTALSSADDSTSLPYGLAIAGGAMLAYLVI